VQVMMVTAEGRQTALQSAAWKGHHGCLERLLQHRPRDQIAARDVNERSALMFAAEYGHTGCLEVLLKDEPDMQPERKV
jgi:ankyrin repeat protein